MLDQGNNRVRRLDLASGVSSTITGGRGVGFSDGSAQQAKFSDPQGIAVSPDGTWIAVADSANHAIRRVHVATAVTSTLVGLETCVAQSSSCVGSGLPAAGGFKDGFVPWKLREVLAAVCSTSATPVFADGVAIMAIDSSTTRLTLTVTHKGKLKTEIDAERQAFTQKAGTFQADIAARLSVDQSSIRIECAETATETATARCSGTPPLLAIGNSTQVRVVVSNLVPAQVKQATRLAFSTDGLMLVLSDTGNNAIRKLDLMSMTLTTLAGKSTGDAGSQNGHASNAVLTAPAGVAISADKRIVLIAEPASHSVRRLDLSTGQISTLAGNGTASALNGKAEFSTFRNPVDVSFGPNDAWAVVVDKGNLSLAHSLSRSLALSLSRSLAHSLSRSLALSLSRSLARSLSRSLALSLSRALSLFLSLPAVRKSSYKPYI